MAGSSTPRSAPPRSRRSSGRGTRAATPTRPAGKKRFFDYPRTGYQGLHRWLPSWRVVLGTVLGGAFLLLGAGVAAYATIDVPKPGEDVSAQTSTIYYADNADGSQGDVMGTYAVQKREIVDYDTLPAYVGESVVAGEDRTFFTNRGVSITGMARAFLHNATADDGTTQGGSTLTQQYVERYYVDKTTTDYVGKAREALLAIKIAQQQSKPEILGNYLNTIYFGRDSYGIQAAAQSYFGVDAKDLTQAQAALLAAVIPSPNNWDPAVDAAKSEQRWNIILDGLQDMGKLSDAQRAKLTFPDTVDYKRTERYTGTKGYLLTEVEKELEAGPLKITKDELMRGGYKIVTTIQKPVQKDMESTAKSYRNGEMLGEKPNKRTKLAMVSVDPSSGAIVGMYGGSNFVDDQINRATYDKIQAGSTFKPFTLIAALESGKTLESRYNGYSPMTVPGWTKPVPNFGGEQFGNINLIKATAESVNTVYAQLNEEIGPEKTADVAVRAGITTPVGTDPSNVLGTADVHPLDMASAYATLAAQGVHHDPYMIAKIENYDGTTAYEAKSKGKRVFDADVVADATYAMQQVVQSGSGETWIKPLDRPIAGKTGTTNEWKAAWFVGFTPQIATAVSLSQVGEDGKSQETIEAVPATLGGVTGGKTPAEIWASYMKGVFELPQYEKVEDFPARADVGPTPTARPKATTTPTPTPTPTETQETVDRVPSGLVGKLQADASGILVQAGLNPAVTTAYSDDVVVGRVISVSPGEGKKIKPGATVTLVISSGPKPEPTKAPEPTKTTKPTQQPSPPATPAPTQEPTPTEKATDPEAAAD